MNKDYLNSKNTKAKSYSLKQIFVSLIFLLFVGFAWGQQTATITTDRVGFFVLQIDNTGGALLQWSVLGGGINIPSGTIPDSNNPTIDLTGNTGGAVITITSTDDFLRLAKLDIAGMNVTSLDISNMDALQELRIASNDIGSLDLSGNTSLTFLNAKNNNLSVLDFSNNAALTWVDLESNNFAAIDISSLVNVEHFDIEYNNITTINIDNNSKLTNFQIGYNPITNATIDYVLNTLDPFGLSGGILEVDPSFTLEGAYVTTVGIDSYRNLVSRGWTIDLDPSIDYGDAPTTYLTQDPNGASHLRVFKQEFWIGLLRDTENNGFAGPNADGDDTNNFQDEDGVNPIQFDNISETTTSVPIDVSVLNNTTANGELHAWIDFDRNGTFDADEHVTVVAPPTPSPVPPSVKGAARKAALKKAVTTYTLTWSNIGTSGPDIVPGPSYARFRFTSDPITANDPGGINNAGEVEDYGFEILTDFDKDGIPDIADKDADNDGILNINEGFDPLDLINSVDTDGDGMPDGIDLDADGDLCLDANEAGQIDGDGDGIVGTGTVVVDSDGLVISDANGPIVSGGLPDETGAYTAPFALDLDGNSVWDFQEAGIAASITTDPVDQDFVMGGSATFTATAVADTYQWEVSNDGGTNWVDVVDDANNTGATTDALTVSNLTAADSNNVYRLKVDYLSFACDTVQAVSAEAGFNMLITATTVDVTCNADSDGSIDITVLGGILPYTYAWTTADGSGLVATDEDQTGLTAGTYDVTVTDGNGETITGSYVITEPDAIVLTEIITNVSIAGAADGAIALTVAGGTAPYIYAWTTLDGIGLVPADKDQTGLTAGTYNVTVTDANNCEISGIYTVTQPGPLTLTEVLTSLVCNGDADGEIAITVGGGVLPYTYAWSTADGSGLVPTDEDQTGLTAGTYNVIVTDANGATIIGSYTLTQPDAIVLTEIITDVTIAGAADGAIALTVAGGTAPYTYAWTTADGSGLVATDKDQTGLTAGTYDVIVTDTNGCEANASYIVNQPGALAISASIINVSCNGLTDGAIDITVTGGITPFTYAWTTADGSGLVADAEDQTGLTTGTYDVIATDVNGATIEGSYTLTEPDVIVISEVTFTEPTCPSLNDGSIIITATGTELEYSIDNGVTFQDENIFSDLVAGTFDVIVRVKTSTTCSEAYGTQIVLTAPTCADLQVTKTQTGGPNPVTGLGQTIDYTITLDNIGLVDITDVNIVDILPDGSDGVLDGPTGDEGVTGVIEVGEIWTYTISYTSTIDDFIRDIPLVNTVIVTVNELLDPKEDTATTPIEGTDTDKDGVIDVFDLDDDNDGVLDTVEGEGDTNGDGVIDRLSLDADGDNCPDVTEAGFTNNGNDMLGTANPPVVDADGLVTSANDGYTTPNDLNNSGGPDFQEAGLPSEIFSDVEDMEVGLGDDFEFTIDARATYYQWQVSTDNGSNWSDLANDGKYEGVTTPTLKITDARGRLESNLYRVLLTSPDYACDPNPELYSRAALLSFDALKIPNAFTPNGDGKNDLFRIPGLDQYPNWSLEIHNRYGSKVYLYKNNGSANPQWWDGYSGGDLNLGNKRVPSGTYFYILHFNGDNRKPVNGWVYITY